LSHLFALLRYSNDVTDAFSRLIFSFSFRHSTSGHERLWRRYRRHDVTLSRRGPVRSVVTVLHGKWTGL